MPILRQKLACVAIGIFFLLSMALGAWRLDGDPSPLKRLGDVNDEGWWLHNARCKVLFGTFLPDEANQGLIGAPLFTAAEWLCFSVAGVSLFTGRLVSLAALWLILLMLFFLVRDAFSAGKAVLAVAMLGLMHETLMYARWSTPIMPEMCFLTAVLFFWERGKKGSPWWMMAAGGCLPAAGAMKLSSLYFAPSIVLFLAGSWAVRREIDRRRLVLFVAGATLATAVLAGFLLANWQQFRFFAATYGKASFAGSHSEREGLRGFLSVLGSPALMHPGVAILTVFVSLWLLEQVVAVSQHGLRSALCRLSTAEFYSLCWLAGSMTALAVSTEKADRRFVLFFAPMTILAAMFTLRQFQRSAPTSGRSDGVVPRSWLARIAFWLAATLVWGYYTGGAIILVGTRALYADALRLRLPAYAASLAASALVAAVFFLLRKPKVALAGLLGLFFAVSLTLDGLWYLRPSYTMRDASRSLASAAADGTMFVGYWSHELSLENRALPIRTP
ncbi:MAG: glycosyltransferase family 39 protein, partial [Thermoguttaceae bacterium]